MMQQALLSLSGYLSCLQEQVHIHILGPRTIHQ